MSHKNDDLTSMSSPVLQQAPIQQDLRDQAFRNLWTWYKAGMLPPVEGWDHGSSFDAFMDILGLNGRPMMDNWRAAQKSGRPAEFSRPKKQGQS